MKQNCPVCFEFLFDSVRPTAVLNCGHTIHETCLLVSSDTCAGQLLTCMTCSTLENQAGRSYVTNLKMCVLALALKIVKSTLCFYEKIWGVTLQGLG